jgi:hypothetical protein
MSNLLLHSKDTIELALKWSLVATLMTLADRNMRGRGSSPELPPSGSNRLTPERLELLSWERKQQLVELLVDRICTNPATHNGKIVSVAEVTNIFTPITARTDTCAESSQHSPKLRRADRLVHSRRKLVRNT